MSYNLYEYVFPSLSPTAIGSDGALPVPVRDFNAQAGLAGSVTTFTVKNQ
jgi:hypothetical protein